MRHNSHVALTGSDSNPGTQEKPFATFGAARDAIRKLKRDGLKTPVEVIVQAGTYHMAEPLTFSPEDSGTQQCPITYKAADGAKVVVSGGKPLTGWRRVNDKLWALDTPPGLPDFRMLRVGDQWATRARHPNYDPAQPHHRRLALRRLGWRTVGARPVQRRRAEHAECQRPAHVENPRCGQRQLSRVASIWPQYEGLRPKRDGRPVCHSGRRRQSDPAPQFAQHRLFYSLSLVARGRPSPSRRASTNCNG